MATFHDSALGSAAASSVGPLATTDALTVTAGDLVASCGKWESGTTTVTFDSGASTPLFTVANAVRQESGSLTCGAIYFWIATATGTINPRMTLGAARDFREHRALSITPAAGKTFVLGNVNAADGPLSATLISAGTAAATGAGVGITGIALFGSRTITPGTNWLEPAEFNTSISAHAQYQLISGSGTITGDCTLSSAVEFVIQLALFMEVALPSGAGPLSSTRQLVFVNDVATQF